MHNVPTPWRSRRSAVAWAVMALVVVSVPAPSGALPTKGKILEFGTQKRYKLSVDGTFSLTAGEAVESGTLNAPKIVISRVPVGKAFTWIGSGTGRITDQLSMGPGCQLDGAIIMTMFGAGPGPNVPASTLPQEDGGDLANVYPTPVIPVGYVGVSVNGAVASGMKSKTCTFEGPQTRTVTMAGLAATTALALANEGALIFPSAGGIIVRSSAGNPSYTFTYQLKKA